MCMRQARLLKNGVLYHVTARVNHKEKLLDRKNGRELFLAVLAQAKRKFSFTIQNFVVLDNHFHLLIRPGTGESLSRIMQWVMGVFAMRLNRLLGLWGHVWGDRFRSWIVEDPLALGKVSRYIDQNAVAAGLVKKPSDWQSSAAFHWKAGIRLIVGPQPPGYQVDV